MKVCVIGTGYVGLVAGVCIADTGQSVTCIDVDANVVRRLNAGTPTIYEPGLEEILKRCLHRKRLTFSTDLSVGLEDAEIVFVCVGTPPLEDGSADLSAVYEAATQIARGAGHEMIVVMKSTVPVGTHAKVAKILDDEGAFGMDYVSNPEFLKEGNAIEDFTKPDRVILGATNRDAAMKVAHVYMPFMRQSERFVYTDPATAEMAKYAANAMLAMRVTFMNELSQLCSEYGADVEGVRRGIGMDRRIGRAFLFPGLGYGGFCFPKDVQALEAMGREKGVPMLLAKATHEANRGQADFFQRMVKNRCGGDLSGKRIAAWGLAYKARTDDVRMSPAVRVVRWLAEQGAEVYAHDPEAEEKARRELKDCIQYGDDMYDVLENADALVILTDWQQYRSPDLATVRERLRIPVVIDGRNLLNPEEMHAAGLSYYCIGRPSLQDQR